jgi:two-component system catabolic regulation response regulator CreB
VERRRVLVVDDNRSLAATVAEILSDGGYEVDVVTSGAQALITWRSRPADLVVLDVDLPDIGGLAVARRLARRVAHLGLVVMSANDPQRLIPACEELGAVFLAKPFSPSHLMATVRLILDRIQRRVPTEDTRPATRLLGPRKPLALLQHFRQR